VRARLLASERRLGVEGARHVAACATLADALGALGSSPYQRVLTLELGLGEAQRAIVSKPLLDLRLLAGWLPGDALGLLRTLGSWYELANLEDRIAYLNGAGLRQPFELGSIAVAWPRAADAASLEELRHALASSSWGDPGGETPVEVALGLRLAWARRVAAEVPEVRSWAASAAALLIARELFVAGLPVEILPLPPFQLLGSGWQTAGTFARFVDSLPSDAAWALAEAEGPEDLWRCERHWWARIEGEAEVLLRSAAVGRPVVVGAVALLAADARRTAEALEFVVRRGLPGVEEVLEVIDAAA
jgi:hypothetical protein